MDPRWRVLFWGLLFAVAIGTSAADDTPELEITKKSELEVTKKKADGDDKEPSDEAKAKRSQEEIMFGNQQNKPAGLVDDLLVIPEGKNAMATAEDATNTVAKNATDTQGNGIKDGEALMTEDHNEPDLKHGMPDGNGRYDYYELLDEKGNSQYQDPSFDYTAPRPTNQVSNQDGLLNSQLYELQDLGEYPSYDYNNELYRRKRTALNRPVLRPKRKLRSAPLGKMYRRCRLPHCPPRLKRQVGVEDLLSLLGSKENNDRYYANDEQLPEKYILPVEVPDSVNYDLPYPYAIARDNQEDEDAVMPSESYLAPPPNYSIRMPQLQREREEVDPLSLLLSLAPAVAGPMSRRTGPYLFPQDYRFIAGHKKRSQDRYAGDLRPVLDQGHWGRIVQVPEAYATPEDVARLYALAKLLAESDDME